MLQMGKLALLGLVFFQGNVSRAQLNATGVQDTTLSSASKQAPVSGNYYFSKQPQKLYTGSQIQSLLMGCVQKTISQQGQSAPLTTEQEEDLKNKCWEFIAKELPPRSSEGVGPTI